MPFTPFHFGPAACVALPLRKKVDVPAFLLVNVAVDVEPLLVMIFGLRQPLHGYTHTLIGAAMVGLLTGYILYAMGSKVRRAMGLLSLEYEPVLRRALISGVLGGWLHVLMDAPLYADVQLFYPMGGAPLLFAVPMGAMYLACAVSFLPALWLYSRARRVYDPGR